MAFLVKESFDKDEPFTDQDLEIHAFRCGAAIGERKVNSSLTLISNV